MKHDFSGNCAIRIPCRLPLSPENLCIFSLVSAFLLCAGLVETSSDQTGVVLKAGSPVAGSDVQHVFGYRAESGSCFEALLLKEACGKADRPLHAESGLVGHGSTFTALRKVSKHGERV